MQDQDRLLLHTAEMIRSTFLCQNAYTDDAFSPLEKTLAAIKKILDFHKDAEERLKKGVALSEIIVKRL